MLNAENEEDWCIPPLPPPSGPDPDNPADQLNPIGPTLPTTQQAFRLSTLCDRGWQPQLLTGMLINFLRDQWSSAVNIFNPDLQQSTWNDQLDSGILIESVTRYKPETAGQRPAILVKRNRIKIASQGIGGRQQGVIPTALERGAFVEYYSVMTGSHTIFCVNWAGATTELLSTEVLHQLLEFAPPIRARLKLHQFDVLELGAVHSVAEGPESYVVPITVGWSYEIGWQLKLQSLPLKTFQFDTSLF
jgi:hypothetical protein